MYAKSHTGEPGYATQAVVKVSDVIFVKIVNKSPYYKRKYQRNNQPILLLPSHIFDYERHFGPRFFSDANDLKAHLILLPSLSNQLLKAKMGKKEPKEAKKPKLNHFQYSNDPEKDLFDKIDVSWNRIIVWLYDESAKDHRNLLKKFNGFLVQKRLSIFKQFHIEKQASIQTQLTVLNQLWSFYSQNESSLVSKYMIGVNLNKLYHDSEFSTIQRLTLLNILKEFGQRFVDQKEELNKSQKPQIRIKRTNEFTPNKIEHNFIDEEKINQQWQKLTNWIQESGVERDHRFKFFINRFLLQKKINLLNKYEETSDNLYWQELKTIEISIFNLAPRVDFGLTQKRRELSQIINTIFYNYNFNSFQKLAFYNIWKHCMSEFIKGVEGKKAIVNL